MLWNMVSKLFSGCLLCLFEGGICIFHRTKLAKIGKKYDEAYIISKKRKIVRCSVQN